MKETERLLFLVTLEAHTVASTGGGEAPAQRWAGGCHQQPFCLAAALSSLGRKGQFGIKKHHCYSHILGLWFLEIET